MIVVLVFWAVSLAVLVLFAPTLSSPTPRAFVLTQHCSPCLKSWNLGKKNTPDSVSKTPPPTTPEPKVRGFWCQGSPGNVLLALVPLS